MLPRNLLTTTASFSTATTSTPTIVTTTSTTTTTIFSLDFLFGPYLYNLSCFCVNYNFKNSYLLLFSVKLCEIRFQREHCLTFLKFVLVKFVNHFSLLGI